MFEEKGGDSLIEAWLIEFLFGIGRLFLHPLFYFLIGFTLFLGLKRVQRERKAFHIRVYDIFHEAKTLFPSGILAGLIISIVTIAVGVVIPFGSIVLMAIITILLSIAGKARYLSPAYVLGVTFFGIIFLSNLSIQQEFIVSLIDDLNETSLSAVLILAAMLVVAEGILILTKGHKGTSPDLLKSKRGQPIGAHIAQRVWMVPVFLLIPGSAVSTHFDWWPVFTVAGEQYSLLFVPFGIGFYHKVKRMLPIKSISQMGKRVIILGGSLLILSIISIWAPFVTIIAVCLGLLVRAIITVLHQIADGSDSFFFSKRDNGLLILGILPYSPAEKMALQIGETISKVNGISVKNVDEFYLALQKNRALCKLEVLDFNDEIRFVQRTLYDGEHHELGILFVEAAEKWNNKAV